MTLRKSPVVILSEAKNLNGSRTHRELLTQISEKARGDAYHFALAAFHGMDFLVTWNFGHILNPRVRTVVQAINTVQGISTPIVCTLEELMEVEGED